MNEAGKLTEEFGCLVFNDKIMKERLPKDIYKAVHKTIEKGTHLELDVANCVAATMKEWAVEKGITSGVSEDKYGPDLSCTRAQVVTFLWIACGSEDAGTETGFDDVDVDAYYDKAVAWAVEKGITAGTSENEFSPETTITRAQFVTMLWVAQGKPEADGDMPFTDVPEDAYYAKAVAWAYANDITAGKSADSFAPDDPCTRGQIMTFLYNAYEE